MPFLGRRKRRSLNPNVWARPEMNVIFRAEIMPGKLREERTFRIERVLPNGRVILKNVDGEYSEGAFEPLNFRKNLNHDGQNS